MSKFEQYLEMLTEMKAQPRDNIKVGSRVKYFMGKDITGTVVAIHKNASVTDKKEPMILIDVKWDEGVEIPEPRTDAKGKKIKGYTVYEIRAIKE